MFIRVVMFAAIIESIAKLQNVQTQAGMGTTETERGFTHRNLALFIGLVRIVATIVISIAHEFARNAHRIGALEFIR